VAALNEWFVSMSAVQDKLLPGVNLQLYQPLFKLLTLELDQLMLECLMRRHIQPRFTTFNFNLETIFTRKFEELGPAGIARKQITDLALGVEVFQGFYVDALMKVEEERARFLVG